MIDGQAVHIVPSGDGVLAIHDMRQWEVSLPHFVTSDSDAAGSGGDIRAPMHGKITQVFAEEGQAVSKGERIAVLEAMKMEHVLHAPFDGVVEQIAVKDGVQIEEDALVARISEAG